VISGKCCQSSRPQTQLGSRSCDRLPCRRTSIRLPEPKPLPRLLVSAARYIRAAPRSGARFHGLLGRAARRPSQLCGFAPLRSSEDSLRFARSTDRPEGLSCFAVAPARFRPKALRFRRLAPLDPPEGTSSFAICSTPKTRRLPESRIRSVGLIRRSTRLPGSVVGAGRDHPKSLSIPGHRRPYEEPSRSYLLRIWNIGDACSGLLACAIRPGSAGADVPPSKPSSFPCGPACFSKLKSLNKLPISRQAVQLPDVMKLSSIPIRAKR